MSWITSKQDVDNNVARRTKDTTNRAFAFRGVYSAYDNYRYEMAKHFMIEKNDDYLYEDLRTPKQSLIEATYHLGLTDMKAELLLLGDHDEEEVEQTTDGRVSFSNLCLDFSNQWQSKMHNIETTIIDQYKPGYTNLKEYNHLYDEFFLNPDGSTNNNKSQMRKKTSNNNIQNANVASDEQHHHDYHSPSFDCAKFDNDLLIKIKQIYMEESEFLVSGNETNPKFIDMLDTLRKLISLYVFERDCENNFYNYENDHYSSFKKSSQDENCQFSLFPNVLQFFNPDLLKTELPELIQKLEKYFDMCMHSSNEKRPDSFDGPLKIYKSPAPHDILNHYLFKTLNHLEQTSTSLRNQRLKRLEFMEDFDFNENSMTSLPNKHIERKIKCRPRIKKQKLKMLDYLCISNPKILDFILTQNNHSQILPEHKLVKEMGLQELQERRSWFLSLLYTDNQQITEDLRIGNLCRRLYKTYEWYDNQTTYTDFEKAFIVKITEDDIRKDYVDAWTLVLMDGEDLIRRIALIDSILLQGEIIEMTHS